MKTAAWVMGNRQTDVGTVACIVMCLWLVFPWAASGAVVTFAVAEKDEVVDVFLVQGGKLSEGPLNYLDYVRLFGQRGTSFTIEARAEGYEPRRVTVEVPDVGDWKILRVEVPVERGDPPKRRWIEAPIPAEKIRLFRYHAAISVDPEDSQVLLSFLPKPLARAKPRSGAAEPTLYVFSFDRVGEYKLNVKRDGYISREVSVTFPDDSRKLIAVKLQRSGDTPRETPASETTAQEVATKPGNHAPSFVRRSVPLFKAGESLSFVVSANDPDNDELTYVATLKPRGARLDRKTGRFTWKPMSDQVGRTNAVFEVTDPKGGSDTWIVPLTVAGNEPPRFRPIASKTVKAGESLSFVVSANDPDNDKLTYEMMSGPKGARFDPKTRRFTWTPAADQIDRYTATFRVRDASKASTSIVVPIEVKKAVATVAAPPKANKTGPATATRPKAKKTTPTTTSRPTATENRRPKRNRPVAKPPVPRPGGSSSPFAPTRWEGYIAWARGNVNLLLFGVFVAGAVILLIVLAVRITRRARIARRIQVTPTNPRNITPHAGATLRFGHYEILDEIGRGGMGVVYRARRRLDTSPVIALKIPFENMLRDDEFRERFLRQAEIGAQLSHPHIVTILDAGEVNDVPYIAMEYIEGSDLRHRVQEEGKLPIPVAVSYTIQICEALDYVHLKQIYHRDLKPENVLISRDGQVKVMDFGIALAKRLPRLSMDGVRWLSGGYLCPDREVTAGTDLYLLGIVFYEMLLGYLPFESDDLIQLLRMHEGDPVPPMRAQRPEIPEDVETVVMKLLAKDPAERFQQAVDVIRELRPYASASE